MSTKLIYVVGPSGAGKDSLLQWLRDQLPADSPVHWVRRTITRPREAGSEDHESVDEMTFDKLLQSQQFALHWQANALRYGIRHSELEPLARGQWVFLNGSRAELENTAAQFPNMTFLHITAHAEVLKQRLQSRGRETAEAIEARLRRAIGMSCPPQCRMIEVQNNAKLSLTGAQLLQQLRQFKDWPF
jgi:ribose 1,5-bisphosphokinase